MRAGSGVDHRGAMILTREHRGFEAGSTTEPGLPCHVAKRLVWREARGTPGTRPLRCRGTYHKSRKSAGSRSLAVPNADLLLRAVSLRMHRRV